MGCRHLAAALACLGLTAGCGGQSPSSPSASGSSSSATQSAVMSAVSQAMSQTALAGRTTTVDANTITLPCSGGGSMIITLSPLPQVPNEVFRSSSRLEFRDCRNQNVTMNGDPYLDMSIELSFSTPGGALSGNSTSTLRTTGGVRMNSNGVLGRAQFNCTTTVNITVVNGSTPQVSVSSTGTTTFEQPIGSTPVTRSCGPS